MSKAHDHLMTKVSLARFAYKAPAVMAVVVRHHGAYVVSALKGVRRSDLAEDAPGNRLRERDAFALASCAKPVSGYMLAVLLKVTQYDWGTTIGEVFPELQDAACRRHYRIRDDYLRTTIRQIMSHTARFRPTPKRGTYEYLKNMVGNFDDRQTEEYCSRDAEMRRRYNYVLASQQDAPGPVGVYSGGPILPAAMMERVTGKSYEALMREYVFDPLGMRDAGVGRTSTEASPPDGVWQHSFDFNAVEFVPNASFSRRVAGYDAHSPAGGVHLAADDAAKFIAANCVNYSGRRPLKGVWLEETFKRFANDCSVSGWLTSDPSDPVVAVSHDGDHGACRARITIWPHRGEGYAVCTSGGGTGKMGDTENFNIGLQVVNAVTRAIEEMLANWGTMFPGE